MNRVLLFITAACVSVLGSGNKTTYLDELNKGKELSINSYKVDRVRTQTPETSASESKEEGRSDFKIQLVASTSISSVHSAKKDAESKLSIPCFILSQSPYYKLAAGSFKTREKAEQKLEEIKGMGYPDAWIIKTSGKK